MAVDLPALVELLRRDPEQRAALRSVLLGDGADVEAALARLAQAQALTEQRVAELGAAQTRTEQRLDALAKDVRELAHAQLRTEDSLKGLVDVVAGMNDRLAALASDALEQRYRDRGHAYFSQIARRLHQADAGALAVLVDDEQQAGVLSAREGDSLLLADAVFSGIRHPDRTPVHLVAEVSVTIGHSDVRRARERADLLARVVDTPVLAVVAGRYAPDGVALAAHDADVWRVTNGHAVAPGQDEPDD